MTFIAVILFCRQLLGFVEKLLYMPGIKESIDVLDDFHGGSFDRFDMTFVMGMIMFLFGSVKLLCLAKECL